VGSSTSLKKGKTGTHCFAQMYEKCLKDMRDTHIKSAKQGNVRAQRHKNRINPTSHYVYNGYL